MLKQGAVPLAEDFTVKQLAGLKDISAEDWNRLTNDHNPFLKYEYLSGLEEYQCLDGHGWLPCHFVLYKNKKLIAAHPLYLRNNSYGEFVFDWAWADAYERAGGRYYPKLVSTIPFAPVIGPRFLIDPDVSQPEKVKQLLMDQIIYFSEENNLSSYHCLFNEEEVFPLADNQSLLQRLTCQFHWHNRDYQDFQDFLDAMTSKRRKQIKRERKQVNDANIDIDVLTGNEVSDEQWQVFYNFYCSTFYRRWGEPRLTLDFFRSLSLTMPQQTLLILAKQGQEYVAGAFSMLGNNTLYGRHWGCNEEFPFLHFELCYYQTIEYCIKNNLSKVDAGVQGEHKLHRGFDPVAARSYHWICHSGLRGAVADFLQQETPQIQTYIKDLQEHLPYKFNENSLA